LAVVGRGDEERRAVYPVRRLGEADRVAEREVEDLVVVQRTLRPDRLLRHVRDRDPGFGVGQHLTQRRLCELLQPPDFGRQLTVAEGPYDRGVVAEVSLGELIS
jgi:hypothetical protein